MPYFLLFFLLLSSCGKSSSVSQDSTTIQGINTTYHLPSLSTLKMKNGVVDEETYSGVRKIGASDTVQPDDAYHLGSCTKAMTATLAAILVEEGLLSWDRTLSSLLPDVSLNPSFQNMRFDMLLVHRAGLPEFDDFLFRAIQGKTALEGKELVLTSLLTKAPSTSGFVYSNYGYIIVGRILERLTGKSYESLMREKLFSPLGMSSCGFGPAPLVWGHVWQNNSWSPRFSDNPEAFSPAGRVHCSLRDWGKFLEEHNRGFHGENGIVTAATFKKLHSTFGTSDSTYTYGGWLLNYRSWANGMTLSHAGSNTMNMARVWIAPGINSIFMSSTNAGGDTANAATEDAIGLMLNAQSQPQVK